MIYNLGEISPERSLHCRSLVDRLWGLHFQSFLKLNHSLLSVVDLLVVPVIVRHELGVGV